MKLLIICSNINSTGPAQVALSFLMECRSLDNEYHIITGPGTTKLFKKEHFPGNFNFYSLSYFATDGVICFVKNYIELSKFEKKIKPHVVFTLFGNIFWKPKTKHIEGFVISYYLYPESSFFKLIPFHKRILWGIKKIASLKFFKYESAAYIVETNIMKIRLSAIFPKKQIYVVPNTYSGFFLDNQSELDIQLNTKLDSIENNNKFRLITISSYKRHKNLEIIKDVINVLKRRNIYDVQFILTIDNESYNRIIPVDCREFVINIGHLHPSNLPCAYKVAHALFLPTLLESFSASYPEAMKMGKPILTSNYDFAIDICKDAGLYFDPLDPNSIADTILLLKNDKILYSSMVQKGTMQLQSFITPASRAKEYLTILKNYV